MITFTYDPVATPRALFAHYADQARNPQTDFDRDTQRLLAVPGLWSRLIGHAIREDHQALRHDINQHLDTP